MPPKDKKKSNSATAGKANGQANSGTGSTIAYNPNQEATLSSSIPMPENWGNGEIQNNIVTCQESLRQMYSDTMQTVTDVTNTVDGNGIQDTRRSSGNSNADAGIEKIGTPAGAVSPPLGAGDATGDEAGIPTGIEDKVTEQIDNGLEKLREILEDLDVTITVKNVDDGKEIRIRSAKEGAVPTSDEKNLSFEIMKGAKVDVSGPQVKTSDKSVVHLISETGGEVVRIASIGDTGTPTADETGNASVVLQSKNDLEQKGLLNTFVGFQASVTIGPLFNIQTNV